MALPARWNPFRPNNVRNLGSRGPLARQHENTLDLLRCAACGQAPCDELGATQLPCQPPAEHVSQPNNCLERKSLINNQLHRLACRAGD